MHLGSLAAASDLHRAGSPWRLVDGRAEQGSPAEARGCRISVTMGAYGIWKSRTCAALFGTLNERPGCISVGPLADSALPP